MALSKSSSPKQISLFPSEAAGLSAAPAKPLPSYLKDHRKRLRERFDGADRGGGRCSEHLHSRSFDHWPRRQFQFSIRRVALDLSRQGPQRSRLHGYCSTLTNNTTSPKTAAPIKKIQNIMANVYFKAFATASDPSGASISQTTYQLPIFTEDAYNLYSLF